MPVASITANLLAGWGRSPPPVGVLGVPTRPHRPRHAFHTDLRIDRRVAVGAIDATATGLAGLTLVARNTIAGTTIGTATTRSATVTIRAANPTAAVASNVLADDESIFFALEVFYDDGYDLDE